MSSKEVFYVMGKPQKAEAYQTVDGLFEFWLYITEVKDSSAEKLEHSNYTPLFIKKNVLIGWGKEYYRTVMGANKNTDINKE
jgi:hypothetical protein